MAGVYCGRCQTKVLLEQDGRSCSNCGNPIIGPPAPPPAKRPPRKRPARKSRP